MLTAQRKQIKVELPEDILFAMKGFGETNIIQKKLKLALSLLLFQEKTISLGKATELAEMSRVDFIELLQLHQIPVYKYTDGDFMCDLEAVAAYSQAVK